MKERKSHVLGWVSKVLFGLGALVLCATSAVHIVQAQVAKNNEVVWSEISLDDEYGFGSVFAIPQRLIEVNDQAVMATATLEYPKGRATTLNQVTLDEGGEYAIHYYGVIDGNTYTCTEKFQVSNRIAAYGGKTSIDYGKHELALEAEGLLMRVGEGESVTFSTIIDLNGATRNDILVEGFVTPDIAGSFDFEELYFTFTDVVDPSITLTMRGRHYALGVEKAWTYWLAGGDGQVMAGYEPSSQGIHRGNRWGTPMYHSFAARDHATKGGAILHPDTTRFYLSFDMESKTAYVNDSLIADLDDSKYFNNLWSGFKSGRVKLTVHANMYTATTANFCLTKVRGVDLTAQKNVDTKVPEITVDTIYDVMPSAKIGMSYPVPSATAHDDVDGSCQVITSVWYNYASDNSILIPVVNGRFDVSKRGNYVIEYRARDSFGNEEVKTFVVKATNDIDAVTIETDADRIVENTILGNLIMIPDPLVSGGSGKTKCTVLVTLNGESVVLQDNQFIPWVPGEYKVEYSVEDFIGQSAQCSYTINVAIGEGLFFVEEPVLPHMFVSGSAYDLPEVYVTDYRNGTVKKEKATISVVDAAGERILSSGKQFVPTVDTHGDIVKIVYSFENVKREQG